MAGLGTVVGTVLGWLGWNIGQRTDAASSSGSLHGKVKDVKNQAVVNYNALDRFKDKTARMYETDSHTRNSWVTLVDVSGGGYLHQISAQGSEAGATARCFVRITIDGVLLNNPDTSNSMEALSVCTRFRDSSLSTIYEGVIYFNIFAGLNMRFNTSLKVEIYRACSEIIDYAHAQVIYSVD